MNDDPSRETAPVRPFGKRDLFAKMNPRPLVKPVTPELSEGAFTFLAGGFGIGHEPVTGR